MALNDCDMQPHLFGCSFPNPPYTKLPHAQDDGAFVYAAGCDTLKTPEDREIIYIIYLYILICYL